VGAAPSPLFGSSTEHLPPFSLPKRLYISPPLPPKADETATRPCSRLCVKNIPKYCTEARLRAHFAGIGEMTDCRVLRTRNGQPRQMAFVGFRTPEMAEAARRRGDRSFLDTSRLSVEPAWGVSEHPDAAAARPWSRHTKGIFGHAHAAGAGPTPTEPCERRRPDSERPRKEGARALTLDEEVRRRAKEDPRLREFLAAMQPRAARRTWANGEDDGADDEAAAACSGASRSSEVEEEPLSDSIDGDGTPRTASAGLPGRRAASPQRLGESDLAYLRRTRTVAVGDWDRDGGDSGDGGDGGDASDPTGAGSPPPPIGAGPEAGVARDARAPPVSAAGSDDEAEAAALSRRMGLRGASGAVECDAHAAAPTAAVPQPPDPEVPPRLFVRNLAYSTTEAEMRAAFSVHGDVVGCHLPVDARTGRPRGFGYVTFAASAAARAALLALDGATFQGRVLRVVAAERPPARRGTRDGDSAGGGDDCDGDGGGDVPGPSTGFRVQREAQRRAGAGDARAWSALYLRPDTVAAAVAAHYGVTKGELLERDAADLPARMALGEAWVMAETKRTLAEGGVQIAALERAAAASGAAEKEAIARSSTACLVKNLPWETTEDDLAEALRGGAAAPARGAAAQMAAPRFALTRLVLPPTRGMAVAEWADAATARRAFRALAFRRFRDVPLYLEWAPEGIFVEAATATVARSPPVPSSTDGSAPSTRSPCPPTTKPAPSPTSVRHVHVTNLAFATNDAGLLAHAVARLGGDAAARAAVRSAVVARRRNSQGGASLSRGFGFVEVSTASDAERLRTRLAGSLLDGHALVASETRRMATPMSDGATAATASAMTMDEDAAAAVVPAGSSKVRLVVRNLAFEATKQDVEQLCAPLGTVRDVRVPCKFDRTPRGFAFVEFATAGETTRALAALGDVHFYGRRLVAERARETAGADVGADAGADAEVEVEAKGKTPGGRRDRRKKRAAGAGAAGDWASGAEGRRTRGRRAEADR